MVKGWFMKVFLLLLLRAKDLMEIEAHLIGLLLYGKTPFKRLAQLSPTT